MRSNPQDAKSSGGDMKRVGGLAARRLLRFVATVLAGVGLAGTAAADPPAMRIATAQLMTPAQAAGYYAASPAWSNSTGASGRPAEVQELARALKGDPDLIYEFVRNNVETVWTYGLSKGAQGAILDRAGTAFDQAHLMVELLRQSGFQASYKIGVISVTPAQFQQWTGISSATAACQLLASGGIPGSVNGETRPACNYDADALTSDVQVGHAWVTAVIGGTEYVFDPSFKPHAFKTGLNLASAAGLSMGAVLTSVTPADSCPTCAVPYVRSLPTSTMKTHLTNYASGLQSAIQSQIAAGSAKDLVGGASVIPAERPAGGWRQTSLSYVVGATVTVGPSENLPNRYRTALRVQIEKVTSDGGGFVRQIVDKLLYVDEIYGRRLVFAPNFVTHGSGAGDGNQPFEGWLELRDENVGRVVLATVPSDPLTVPYAKNNPGYSRGKVTLTVTTPYAAGPDGAATGSGGYLNTAFVRNVTYAAPFVIVHAWGHTDDRLVDKWGSPRDETQPQAFQPGCENCVPSYYASRGDGRRQTLAATWMAQSSRAAELHAAIAKSIYTHHYSVGVVSADTDVSVTNFNPPGAPANYGFNVSDSYDRIDVETAFSLTSTSANVADRRAALHAIAATAEALEGSVNAQVSDLPDTASTATRFEWGNDPPPAEDPSGVGARRFYLFNSGNRLEAGALVRSEGKVSSSASGIHNGSNPTIDDTETQVRRGGLDAAIQAYASQGYSVVASEDAFLGPGQRAGAFKAQPIVGEYRHVYSRQRGGALVATRYDANGDPTSIAHVAVTALDGWAKGGGGGAQPGHQAQYDPSKAADVLKARFVDRSSAVGVELQNGQVTYTSPAAIEIGQGDFPYKLSAQLVWRGGAIQEEIFGPVSHAQPQAPWTTNWNNNLSISGSALEAMGKTDVRAMAGTVAAFLALQDLYRAPPSPEREVAGALVNAWWVRQLAGNVVTVSLGADTRQFVRRYDDQWFSPGPGAYAELTQTGIRQVTAQHYCGSGPSFVTTRGYSVAGVSFQVRRTNGDIQNFGNWEAVIHDGSSTWCAHQQGFRMNSWTFPRGVALTFTYETPNAAMLLPELTSVSNNLGQRINFVQSGLGGFDNGLTGDDRRVVTVSAPLAGRITHTDPAGRITGFDVVTSGDRYRLVSVYGADDPNTPALSYAYDSLGRVQIARDKLAVLGQRNPHEFFIGFGARGERVDPGGGRYSVDYDPEKRPTRFVDELGRVFRLSHDGRGRVLSYTYPELDREELAYDDHNNQTLLRKVAKPGSPEAGQSLRLEAEWNATWNKPALIRDAKNQVTNLTYVASGPGAGELERLERPAVDGQRPAYRFTYNAFGQMETATDPTDLVTDYRYDARHFLWKTTVDPGAAPAHANLVTTNTLISPLGDVLEIDGPRTDAADVSRFAYDALRRRELDVQPDPGTGRATARKSFYDDLGRVHRVEQGYVEAGQFHGLIATTYLFDPVGNRVRETTPAGVTQISYDPMNRVLCTARRMNGEAALPADACVPSAQKPGLDGFGPDQITRNSYDAAGQLLQVTVGLGTDAEAAFARHEYTANGEQEFILDGAGNVTKLVYDGFDRLVRHHFPVKARRLGDLPPGNGPGHPGAFSLDDVESYLYDDNGNRRRVTKRDGRLVEYEYDALDRVVRKIVPHDATQNVFYGYDLAGRMQYARYDNTTTWRGIVHGFDSAKRKISEQSYNWTVGVELDGAGNRTKMTWPHGQAVEYVYDAANRLTQVRELGATSAPGVLATFTYDDLGRRKTLTRGNGGQASYSYDAAGRLDGLTQSAGGAGAPSVHTISYTPASQVATLTQANALYVWQGHPTSTRSIAHNGLNQDAAVAALPNSFDKNGNLTDDGVRGYMYDVDNRLILEGDGTFGMGVSYDPLGRLRATRTYTNPADTQLTWTFFLYWENELIGEYAEKFANEPALRRYVHSGGVDEPLVWYEGTGYGQRRWFHADRQGSIIATSDGAGAVTAYTYGPWGEPNDWSGARFRYTGQVILPEPHVYHYKARAYDPATGRFLQTDPVGFDGGDPNLYAYVKNNPVNSTDPTGQWPGDEGGGFNDHTFSANLTHAARQEFGTPENMAKIIGGSYLNAYLQVMLFAAFPEGGGGVGVRGAWVVAKEAMLPEATAFQVSQGGRAGMAYLVNGVKFDGVMGKALMEAKSGYANMIGKDGLFQTWFANSIKGGRAMIDQAQRQLQAAKGAKIVWRVDSEKLANAIRALFKDNDIKGIDVQVAKQVCIGSRIATSTPC